MWGHTHGLDTVPRGFKTRAGWIPWPDYKNQK